jgi:hypothetical protein
VAYPLCGTCGKPIKEWAGRGQPPKHHAECSRKRTGRKSAPRTVPMPTEPPRRAILRKARLTAQERVEQAEGLGRARELAIALRLEKDPKHAARLVGLADDDPELETTIAHALAPAYADLRRGSKQATAKVIAVALAIGAERLLREIHLVPIGSLPGALRFLGALYKELGGGDVEFSSAKVVFRAPAATARDEAA